MMTTIFLCGDVMIGRGIDQIQRRSSDPRLFEPNMTSAADYVRLAEARAGPIPREVRPSYVWGAALADLHQRVPAVRIVNLETAVTTSAAPWPGKDVLYRTHPDNVAVLQTAGVDCCMVANNHVLDWGYAGLEDTLARLRAAGVAGVGAGMSAAQAADPAAFEVPGGRVIVFGIGSTSSGIPGQWAAGPDRPGVNLVEGWSESAARWLAERVEEFRQPSDVVVVSIHWGSNWGYEIPAAQRQLGHALVDAGADLVHGHSSHHPRGMELYRGKLILHGCGDFITDYEGIAGHEHFRDDLVLGYYARLEQADGRLREFSVLPYRLERFRLFPATAEEGGWLAEILDRESREFGLRVTRTPDGSLVALPVADPGR